MHCYSIKSLLDLILGGYIIDKPFPVTTNLSVIASFCVRICPASGYEVCHVAKRLPAYQPSVYVDVSGSHVASYATDGRRDTSMASLSCSVTNLETNPWWAVDLGVPLTVTGVLLTNRDSSGACQQVHVSK